MDKILQYKGGRNAPSRTNAPSHSDEKDGARPPLYDWEYYPAEPL